MAKTYITTRTQKLGRTESVRIANLALRWCRKTLGTNKRKRFEPVWSVLNESHADPFCQGEYDAQDNHIFIYWKNCHAVADIISTCIHEWTHQLQPILTRYGEYYDDYVGNPNYMNNPYEIEARNNEALYTVECWGAIKHKVNKHDSNRKVKRS